MQEVVTSCAYSADKAQCMGRVVYSLCVGGNLAERVLLAARGSLCLLGCVLNCTTEDGLRNNHFTVTDNQRDDSQ